MRKMIPLRRLIEQAEDRGDLDDLFVDEDDVVELDHNDLGDNDFEED